MVGPDYATSGSNFYCLSGAVNGVGDSCRYMEITGNLGTATTGYKLEDGTEAVIGPGHDGITVSNLWVTGVHGVNETAVEIKSNNVTVDHSTISGNPSNPNSALRGWEGIDVQASSVSLIDNNIAGFAGGIWYHTEEGTDVTTGNYIHGMSCWDYSVNEPCGGPDSSPSTSDHSNPIADSSGPSDTTSSWLIQHNTVLCDLTGNASCSSDISLFPDFGPQLNDHVTIDDNLLSGGAFLINNGGGDAYGSYGQSYVTTTNNDISTAYGANGGVFGLFYRYAADGTGNVGTGDVQYGNYWDDGPYAGKSADHSEWYPGT
ncbi:hypothetical protein [Mycobacterium sp.]|uniref:hypothetical protein n=1 Tax=Mycobacterium sp. TaxID=1785 RepID=UPI002C6DBC83|nr:hypothetical protein [Mycobacterium sp.]HTQ21892.1 hypothetical protein [Mycobacterium sp.]